MKSKITMIYYRKNIHKQLPVLVMVFLFTIVTSCMSDNMDDCPDEFSLRFEYVLNDNYQDLFRDQVTHLDLLVYTEQGDYLKTYSILQNELKDGNTFLLDLQQPEKYTLIAWGNTAANLYAKHYPARIEDLYVKLNSTPSGEADPLHGSLFHGITNITHDATVSQSHTMSLTKDTHLLQITLEEIGGNQPLTLGAYTLEITGSNGTYDYQNHTTGNDLLQYIPRYSLTGEHTMQTEYTLLRLMPGDDLHLKIKAADGSLLYSEPLTTKIMQNPAFVTQEDLDRCDTFKLRYEISKTAGGGWLVSLVEINDWDVTGQGGGIG